MQIEHMELYLVRLPLKSPMVVSDHLVESLDTVYLRMDGEGESGWSEVSPGNYPRLSPEWSVETYRTARDLLAPMFMASPFYQEGKKIEEVFSVIRGQQYGKSLFDMAWWDLSSRIKGEPLWKTLGGTRQTIEVGLTFDRDEDQDRFFQNLERLANDHFNRLTLKFRPGWDVQVVAAVRATAPPLLKLQIDAEGVLNMEHHSDTFYRLEDFYLTAIEQPLAPVDLVGHAMLKETIRTPLALDESLDSSLAADIALDLQSAGLFCIKPGRVGGHTTAKEICEKAAAKNVGCFGGFEIASSIAYRHLLSLASLDAFTLPADYFRFDECWEEEPCPTVVSTLHTEEIPADPDSDTPAEPREFQAVDLWSEPGIGAVPDPEILQKYTLDHCSF